MSDTDGVTVTTVVAIDPDAAFEVFTGEVDAWWKHGPRYRVGVDDKLGSMRFEPGVGGRLLEVYDEAAGDQYELGRVIAWEPGERLVFEMGGRDLARHEWTEVEIRFERDPLGTRVTVRHRGWDRFADDHPVRHGLQGEAFHSMMALWWADLLVAHRAHAGRGHGHGHERGRSTGQAGSA